MLASVLVLGLALAVCSRRLFAPEVRGGWGRLPWEPVLVAGVVSGVWWDHWYDVALVDLPVLAAGVAALALLPVAAVALRRGDRRLLTAALWTDALGLVPTLFIVALVSDRGFGFCF